MANGLVLIYEHLEGEPSRRHAFETDGERGGDDPPGEVFAYAPG
ncbi:hypothetical protein LX81_04013 [Palleronia aestuarii]|uniref:Uncharacterized protein n=1 Tax=Palleronia aestuarii TaxID=568105 RepID=A0A2W7MT49_9RHOB|nr:hypothetical protein [Palleronia aestuarii]PZX11265.1 hypothetical protein LX81_04013 [Palleronia aestuarii]